MKLSDIIQDIVDVDPTIESHFCIEREILESISNILSRTDEFKDCKFEVMASTPSMEDLRKLPIYMVHDNAKFTGKVQLYSFYLTGGLVLGYMERDGKLYTSSKRAVMMRGIIENPEGLGNGEKMTIQLRK